MAFDTSKETIAVAIAESGRHKEVRFFGTIASRPDAVRKLVEKLGKRHQRLAFCYEATTLLSYMSAFRKDESFSIPQRLRVLCCCY